LAWLAIQQFVFFLPIISIGNELTDNDDGRGKLASIVVFWAAFLDLQNRIGIEY